MKLDCQPSDWHTLKWSMGTLQVSRSFPLLSYTMSNWSDGYEEASVGLPHTTLAPDNELYWLKGAFPSNLSCT